jgi:hypothetical protein
LDSCHLCSLSLWFSNNSSMKVIFTRLSICSFGRTVVLAMR